MLTARALARRGRRCADGFLRGALAGASPCFGRVWPGGWAGIFNGAPLADVGPEVGGPLASDDFFVSVARGIVVSSSFLYLPTAELLRVADEGIEQLTERTSRLLVRAPAARAPHRTVGVLQLMGPCPGGARSSSSAATSQHPPFG